MAFLDFLFGGAKNNKEEEERKKREQEQAGKRVNDAINKWLTDNSSKWTPAGTSAQQPQTPTFTATQQPQTPTFTAAQPTISGDVYNNILNSRFGTPNLSAGGTKKISGNSPLLINDDAITGNRKGWGYGSGDAPSKEAAKEWDDLLNPDSSLSKSMDKQSRLWRINNEVPAWYVNAHKQGTVDSVMQNVGSNHLLPEDGNIAMGTRNNTTKSVAALYDQRQTGRFDYDIDPWGNLADPSLYSDDYLQNRLDYWKDQSTAKKSKTENAIHSIEDINDAMAWTFNPRDFEHDTDPVSDFELEGFAKYVEGTEFDPNMTNDERQAMANRFLEWGKDDGYLKLQEKLNSQRTGHESTYVENAGVSDAYEDWLGKLEKEAQFRFDYGHMQEEARRDPNFEADAAYDGPISGNDFASRLYNALNDPLERIRFDLPYENGGAANPITAEGYDLMTPKELQEFNWYAKQGRGQEYLDMMKATLQHRNAEAQAIVSQYYATKNFGTAALSWGAARFANLGTAMLYPIQAANALLGGETDAASSLYAPNRMVNDVSEAQTQAIANSNFLQIPGFAPGTNLGTWLYSAATSAADSLLGVTVGTTLGGGPNSGLGKALANLVMSSTAASQALEENLLSGMDPTHAFFTSVADGAAEAITETWSIESLLSDPTHFIPYLAKNFFSEASEEGASSILQAISDRLINGDNSQMANDVNMLVLLGMKKEDAEKRVLSDWLNETLQGMAIGGLSGVMSAGGWAMGNAIGETGAGRRINQTIFQNALNSYTMDQNRQANQTQTVTNEQAQEDGRRAPETPDKAPMDRTQDDTQPKTTPDEKAPENDQRKAPETPDKPPMQREQDVVQPSAAPTEDQRRAPETPDKPPVQREQDMVQPVQTDGVNAQADNVNGDVDGRRAPTQPIQQSARQAEADQAQAAANEKAAQPAEPAKHRAPDKPTKEARQQGDKAVFETQQKVAEIGAGLAEGSEARKVAEAALKKLQKGKRLGNRQTYRLYSQVYNQLDEDLAAPIKSAARQDIEYQLVKDGVEKDQARYAAKSLADILTGNIDNVSDADLNDLLTTKQTRDILHAVGIDSTVLNRKILSMAGNNPIINLQLRQSAYERPENRSTMNSWAMMRRIIEGQYTYQAESGEAKATDGQKANQEYKPTGAKEQITFADADGNDVTGTIVKITTKAVGQKAMAELKEKAATQPADQQTKSTNQQTSNNEAMDGLSDEAKEEWKKIQADRENGPREVKIEGGNGPTMEEFHNMRSQMSARMGEENIDSVNDIVLTVRDGDGNTREISIDDVSGASNEGVQAILEYAMATPEILGTNKLNLMYQWYQGEQPVEYMAAFNHVYNAGFTGYVMDPAAVSALGDSRSEFIYEAGRQAAQEAENVRLENIKNVGKGKGTLTIQGIDNSNAEAVNAFVATLDENQRASYEALKPLAQGTGVNIVLFRSQANENGRITSENGHYDPYTNSLYLDLNAGLNMSAEEYAAQGMSVPHYAILRTAGHELTHYIENSSAEGYAKLSAYAENELMRRYGSETFEDLIERKMDAYARAGNPLTREGAISEVIADSMEMILQDSKAIERLANQDRTVFQRIRDFLHDFAENIRRAFTGVEAGSLEAQLLLQDAEGNPVRYAEKLVKLWDDALIEASAANAVADQTEAQQSVGVLAPSADEDRTISGDRTGFIEMPKDHVQDSVRTYLDMEPKAVGPAFLKNHKIPYEVHSTGIKGRRTVYASGRDITRAILLENGFGEQTDEVLSFMDNIADYMKDAEVQYHYVGLTDVNSATATIDPDSGRILLSCKIKNDEYEVNFDLGTVCKKRQALQNLFNELAARNGKNGATKLDDIELTSEHIFRINEILRDNGYETACLGCFVEARRYKTKAWADRVVGEWNAEVLKQNPNAGYFDFARGRTDIDKMSAAEKKAHYDALKAYNSKGTSGPRDRMNRLAKIPTMQKLLRASDLISEQGRDRLRKFSSTLDSIAQSRDGANAIKPTIGFIPYNSEMALLPATKTKHGKRMTMAQYLKSIGGARSQSFTDFIVTQAFDHLQKTVDMAARKVTAHTYTKELGRAWLFGMTGEKINMSVLFDIDPKQGWQNAGLDANGEYIVGDYVNAQKQFEKTGKRAFTQSIPFKQAVELEHNPLYSKNVGIIGVGYSYNHMKKMLSDENIPYIIMYHRSGMPQEVATAANIAMTTDYTPVQNTQRFLGFRTVMGDGRGVPSYASWGQLSQKKTGASKMTYNNGEHGLSLKQLLADHNGDPIAAMNDLLSWMDQNKLTMNTSAKAPGHGDFDLYGSLNRTMDPTATANEYIKWCMQNEMLPLGWEFCTDPGYYKILYDYSVTDLATGETATQQPVTLDKMLEIGPEQWKAGTDGVHGLDHFMAAYDRTLDRDQSVFEQTLNQVYDELAEGPSETASQGPADVANPTVRAAAVQHSIRSQEADADYMEAVNNGDTSTADRMVRQAAYDWGAYQKPDGGMYFYHGTNADFNRFDPDKIGSSGAGSYMGYGFNFAADESMAEGYGTNLKKVFLKIKNPLLPTKKTITALKLAKVIQQMENYQPADFDGDTWTNSIVWNYDSNMPSFRAGAYEKRNAYMQATRNVARMIASNAESDADIYSEISSSGAEEVASVISAFQNLGYDAVLHNNSDGDKLRAAIVFSPSQIKSAETVTRDDDGNVIPLSQRFDTSSEDIRYSLRLEPMTTTREYIMGLTDEDLQTEAERAVLARYRQKVTEYGTAAAAREKYENDLLNYNGQDQNELTKLNNRAQLARERLNRVQQELEQIEKSNAFVRIAADARQAMSVIQSVAGSGNVDQYLETMRTRLANAQSRMDDILKDLEGWPKPTEGTTARMVFGKTQLNQKVNDLMRSNPSTLSKDEVTDSLAHIALLYQIGDTQAIEDANREVEELARKLQLQKNESIESYELTQMADAIGAFSLNDNQKKEVKRVYGSISNFKKALAGYGRYDPKATNLDANWAEMVELTGNQLDPNIGDAEEPIALVDYISRTVQSAQEAAALSPEDAQNELIEIQTEILTAATDLQAAIPMSRETLTAIQDLIKTFGSRADKLGDQLVQLLHDSEHARANADLAQATYTANGGRIIKGVDAIRSYYSQVADQYTKEILLQKEKELSDRYANQMRILRTNAAQRLQEQANNYRQQIKDVRELRDISQKIRTARNVVRRQVMRVNKLLLQETNTKNVPEGLKGMAEALVTAFARADQNGRGIILSEGEANNLILEYSYLMRRDGELDSYAYDPDILEQLKTIKDQLDEYRMASIGHAYYDLANQRKRLAICQNIAATVNDLTSLIVNANYAFIDGKKVEVGAAADRMAVPMLSMKDYGRPTGGLGRMASNVDEFARWGNMTPYYFKRQIDNAGFTPLMDDLERSEHRWGLQMQSAHDRINEMRENYHAADWTDDKLSISDNRGGTIEITRGQAMSILAIWQREHHDKYFQSHHLEVGGFVLAEDGGKLGKGLLGLDRNAVGRTRGSRITQAEINAIEAWLTDEQKAYMNEMISYLSNEMSDIGNETSMKLYGIKKYKEKVYFPIQSYRGALTMKSDAGAASTTNDSRIEHVGFSNARLRDANNTILIDDFSKVAAGHVQQMLMYANFAPTIEALNKVLNAQFEFEDGEKMRIRQMFENKYGKNAKDYLQDYIKALNGGVNPDTQDSLAGKMISLFKKTAVVGSVSVAAKQPMSIIRAATMINPRYLAAAAAKNLGTLHGSKSFEEARKYAGTAVIKDIGKFDTGVGMSNVDWLLERDSQEYDLWTKAKEALNPRDWEAWKNRWNEILGFLPEKGDTVTWGAMWEAVKMEQHALHPSMNQYSQEFLQMCGERFNTVMRATQVYDSTIARSPNLRSRSQFMKMLTAFMNEPVLTANMLYDSIKNIKKTSMKDHINPAAAGATFLLSAAAQAFITSLFSALRSDDKEKTIAEKMAGTFGQNLRGELNPFNLIPGVADIVEILEGGEVERADLSVLTDTVNKMQKLASGKYAITDAASGWKAVEDVGGSIAKLFGIPVKNVMRELRTVYNVFTQPARATDPTVFRLSLAEGLHVLPDKFLGFTLIDNSTQAYVERMYKALRSGDTKAAADYREYLIDGKGVKEGSIKSKVKSLLYADYAAERIGIDEAIQFGMDQELWKKEKDAYSALIQAADKADHSDQEEYKTSAYVKIYEALLAGDKAAYNAVVKDMASHGYTDKAVQSEAKSQIGKWYKDGELTQAQATSMLAMLGITAKNDVYWTLDAWDYQAENGDSTGYTKYDDFLEAVETGKGLQAAIQAQIQHSDKTEKEVRSTLASQITSKYKSQYVELVRAGRTGEAANLQARLLTAYEALGYNRAKKLKDIQKWLK